MKDDKLEKEIKRFYLDQRLSPEIMERFKILSSTKAKKNITRVDGEANRKSLWFSSKVNLAIAASFTAILLTTIQFFYIFKSPESDLILRVAQEVALNHNKHLATEFDADNYLDLSVVMDKLDFDLKAPNHLAVASYKVLGARYCSIQGQIAGQIKLKDNAGKILTLYITKSNDMLSTLHHKTQERENLMISSWQEDVLFFSLATPK